MKRTIIILAMLAALPKILIGTEVCGNVSGVWDIAGSPYYVNCDVNVPSGQALEIGPGVEVLFTGHYKFNVYGNLQAVGTEEDSIVFTRAYPTEGSKGWGIRFYNADPACSLAYCVIENCHATPRNPTTGSGGGIYMTQSSPTLFRCSIRNNSADYDGGGAACYTSSPQFLECNVSNNAASVDAGGALFHSGGSPIVTRCRIWRNTASGSAGGGGLFNHQSDLSVMHCTIFGNIATSGLGGGVENRGGGTTSIQNSIAWSNISSIGTQVDAYDGTLYVTYSDIQGGYPGAGNIDTDPLFVNAVNGDFHLQFGSPCINAGDPASPRDPDGTIADMGAFPFSDIPLPVELLGLNAVSVSEGIKLQWSTASEPDNDYFEIMRGTSEMGVFNRITTLPSQGNSSTAHQYEYVDREVTAGQTYWYYLADVDLNGNRTEHRELMQSATMSNSAELPSDYALSAYPNPFNPSTTISFALPEADFVRIAVYDVTGRWIQTLVNEKRPAGNHTIAFDARDLPSGVYFARMESGRFAMTKKMLLVR